MRLKDCVVLRNDKTEEQCEHYIALENIKSWDASFVLTDCVTEGTNNRCKAGDILFGKLRPYLAKAYIPENNGICSTEFLVMTAKPQFLNRYILYFLLSNTVIDYLQHQVAGVKMPRTNWETVAALEMPRIGIESGREASPTFVDQSRIVEYLDSRCAAIDRTVTILEQKRTAYGKLKRALINETVMRGLDKNAELVDSGVDWLKPGRKNRSVRRLKDCATLNPNCDNASIVGDVSFVPMEALRWGKIDAQTIPIDLAKGKYTPFADGDLLVARVTPCFERGNIAIASGLLQGVGFGSSEIFVLRVNENAVSKYMFYLTLTARSQDGACATMCGVGGLKRISPEFMRTYELDLPSAAEQRRIADYLDRKCAAIDAAVENVTRQIELYRKLKRSLIDEVVTGRRKVA